MISGNHNFILSIYWLISNKFSEKNEANLKKNGKFNKINRMNYKQKWVVLICDLRSTGLLIA